MSFKASLDKAALIITSILTCLFIVILIGQFNFLKSFMTTSPFYSSIIIVAIYLLGFSQSVKGYMITEKEIIIKKRFTSVKIDKNNIFSYNLVNGEQLKGSLRVFGNGGLFGYYGQFANKTLGKMMWYATRRDKAVLIRTNNGSNIILTPNEPEKFILALKDLNNSLF